MSDQYYIRFKGEVRGPYTAEKLKKMAKARQYGRHFQVSTDKLNWSLAKNYPETLPTRTPRRGSSVASADESDGAGDTVSHDTDDDVYELVDELVEEETEEEAAEWFYSVDDQFRGPVEIDEIQLLLTQGRLGSQNYIWCEGMDDWKAIADFPELFAQPDDAASTSISTAPSSATRASTAITNERDTAQWAVPSLILGILGTNILFGVGSVGAIICGHMALDEIRDSNDTLAGRGQAVAGLILGYAVPILMLVGLIAYGLLKAVGWV